MHKVVLITGGSSGIGRITAQYLASKEYKVYGTSRKPESFTGDINFDLIKLDVCDDASIVEAVNLIIQKEGRIDVLINNAGMGITGALEETPVEELRKVFETNFFGVLRLTQEVLPHMRKNRNGLVINVTSIAGYMGLPYRGGYSATKGALELITEAMRMEVKEFGIEMTNVAPGDFATNIAAGRFHTPLDENSPYYATYKDILKQMDEHVDEGKDPLLMAIQIEKIMNTKKPRVHYKPNQVFDKSERRFLL